MTTSEEIARWDHTLDQAIVPFDQTYLLMGRPDHLPDRQMAEMFIAAVSQSVIEMWEANSPPMGTELRAVIEPVAKAAAALTATDPRVHPIKRMVVLAKRAKERMATGLKDGETADEVVNEMILGLKVLVLAARLGHRGIMDVINDRWGERIADARAGRITSGLPNHIDVLRVEGAPTSSATTIPFPNLLAAAHPGVATMQQFVQEQFVETETEIQRRFAGMWVVTFFTEWESGTTASG